MNVIKEIIKKIISFVYYIIISIRLRFNRKISLEEDKDLLETVWHKNEISCVLEKKRNCQKNIDLSIIVPLYNSEKFIDNLINKVIKQKTKYIYELILVNDGSKDRTLDIVKKYEKKFSRIIKVFNQENGGISKARNTGLNYVNGKYICFIDHDDYIDEDFIEHLLNIAYSNDADIVKCSTASVKNGKTISKRIYNNEIVNKKMGIRILGFPSFIWEGIYKVDMFDNICFPNGYWYEDMITRALIYRKSMKFISTDEILYYRGIHDNHASSNVWSDKDFKCLEQLYLIEILMKDNKKIGLENDVYFYLNLLWECSSIMVNRIKGLDDKYKKQIFIRINKILTNLYREEFKNTITGKWKIKNEVILNKRYDLWQLEDKLYK